MNLEGPRWSRRGFVLTGLLLAAGLVLALATALTWLRLPSLDDVVEYRPRQHLQVLTADGAEIAAFGTERREFVPIERVPQRLKDAVIAVEDAGFYEHSGISWRGLARAFVANLGDGPPQGASTITQQVARTFFLSTRRTFERKFKEALLALRIERRLSKDRILELYLNQIYLGQRSYGFAAAARTYFGKTLDELTLAETAMLAGLPQNPIRANPVNDPARATRRQRWVLSRMEATGRIDAAERAAAEREVLTLRDTTRTRVVAPHVAEMARRAVFERLGERAYTVGVRVVTSLRADDQAAAHAALRRALLAHERRQPWRGPEDFEPLPAGREAAERAAVALLKEQRDDEDLRAAVVLAADTREITALLATGETATLRGEGLRLVQSALPGSASTGSRPKDALAVRPGAVLRLLAQPAPRGAKDAAPQWQVVQWPQAEGAFVALDPATGRVRALVGGFDFGRSQFNRATGAWRQPGSSFKPFLYSAAFEHGVMPETRVDDLPLVGPDGSPLSWNPGNSDDRFDGEMSVRDAIVRSKNLASIRLLQHVGVGRARVWLQRFGFAADRHPADLTLALGSGSVTPLQMAAGYAVFANGGHRIGPVVIERITDAQGQVLFEAPPAPPLDESTRAIPARNAFLVGSLLADVTARGTAARAQAALQRPDLYGKTGTTNDAVDAWFAGFAPGVVAVSWIGHDTPRSLGERESGGGLALPAWIDAMARMLRGTAVQQMQPPAGLVRVEGGDWRYEEWAEGGFVVKVGSAAGDGSAVGAEAAPSSASSASSASAASGAAPGPATPASAAAPPAVPPPPPVAVPPAAPAASR